MYRVQLHLYPPLLLKREPHKFLLAAPSFTTLRIVKQHRPDSVRFRMHSRKKRLVDGRHGVVVGLICKQQLPTPRLVQTQLRPRMLTTFPC